jgi:anti-sigma regulatory factor (Ser/Thr protein kinase)
MSSTNHIAVAAGDRRLPMLREILLSATAGKVRLCLDAAELPDPLGRAGPSLPLGPDTMPEFRRVLYEFAAAQRLPAERRQQLLTAAGEVAMNAVVHGGGGVADLATDRRGTVQVRIQDRGVAATRTAGERPASGYGWWLIARSADRIWIYSDDQGTTVVLEQDRTAPDAAFSPEGETNHSGSTA